MILLSKFYPWPQKEGLWGGLSTPVEVLKLSRNKKRLARFSNGKKTTWYKMLNRFAPDGIVPEEFKLPSFNHVLHQRKNTKMYQVIFFNRHLFTHPFISTFQRLHKSHQAPFLGQPTCKCHQAPFQIISHHMMWALTPFDTSAHTIWCERSHQMVWDDFPGVS